MGGGNITFAVNKYLLPYAEFSYFPGIGREQTGTFSGTGATFTSRYSIPLSDFHAGVHIRFPIHEKPVVPYGVFGMGALTHFRNNVTETFTDASGNISQLPLTVPGGSNFAINFGGGVRFYLSQHFGLRIEAKAYKPTGVYSQVFGKVEGGFFFQLR